MTREKPWEHLHHGAAARTAVPPDLERRLADRLPLADPVRVQPPAAPTTRRRPVCVRLGEPSLVLGTIVHVIRDHGPPFTLDA
jgi:hypothetical protein